jgi:hypothetical protein
VHPIIGHVRLHTNNINLIYQNDVDFVPQKKENLKKKKMKTPFMVKQMGECPIVNIFYLRSAYPLTKKRKMYSNQRF